MNLRDRLILEYNDLAEGETRAGQMCPMCEGGTNGKRTLSVSREGGVLLWHCHRMSCPFSGRWEGRSFNAIRRTQPQQVRGVVGRTYVRDSEAIPEDVKALLYDRLLLDDRLIAKGKLGWLKEKNRVVQPILGVDGEVLGCALRAIDGSTPKSLTHSEPGAMSWYTNRESSNLIIVEDIFSAIRASSYMNSVALLSTHLNDDRVEAIKEAGFDEAFIALDRDAFGKSVQYAAKFRSRLRLIPVQLSKDVKDMTYEEADDLFASLGADRLRG